MRFETAQVGDFVPPLQPSKLVSCVVVSVTWAVGERTHVYAKSLSHEEAEEDANDE